MNSRSQLENALEEGRFVVTAELGPPKSADPDVIKRKCEILRGYVTAANITDNQTAIVRMSSIAAGVLAMQEGIEPIIQMTCRDRNRLALQADILGAHALGIRNVLCITGDHQRFGNHPTSKNVYDMDSIQLVDTLKTMRDEGKFLCGEEIRNSKKDPLMPLNLFIGAAANPFGAPFSCRVIRLAKKVLAGADFIQTQCIYDMDCFKKWMAGVRARGLHDKVYILAGITPLKSVKMAEHMRDNVAGPTVPDSLIDRLRRASDARQEGLEIAIEQIAEIRKIPGVRGVHIMAIGDEKSVPGLLQKAGLLPRPDV